MKYKITLNICNGQPFHSVATPFIYLKVNKSVVADLLDNREFNINTNNLKFAQLRNDLFFFRVTCSLILILAIFFIAIFHS